MGLDMYLTKKTYVKNWDHHKPEYRHEITIKQGGKLRADIKPERICYIEEEVAQWRKANAIHKWFVDNVQDGKDDCRDYYVSHEQIAELVGLCKQVLDSIETVEGDIRRGTTYYPDGKVEEHWKKGSVVTNEKMAADVLPTTSGFFFGPTEYNEYYIEDLRETVKMLEPVLSEEGDGEFYYTSSW